MKLRREYVEKPWGRTSLPEIFDPPKGKRIGEVWLTGGGELPLLAKYLFTSERLSVQVHPSDEQARAHGLHSGKTECWYILEAEAGAHIGLGLIAPVSAGELRAAAQGGSIEQLINWHPVEAGDFILVPPGTIHAIGGGISLLEFQQNADVTYRLYDYGRPRPLHVEEGIEVATLAPFDEQLITSLVEGERRILVDSPPLRLECGNAEAFAQSRRWIMPLTGKVSAEDEVAKAGEALVIEPGVEVDAAGWLLVGATF